jgi:hypothetical protein
MMPGAMTRMKVRRGAKGLEIERDGLGRLARAKEAVWWGECSHKEHFRPSWWFNFSLSLSNFRLGFCINKL